MRQTLRLFAMGFLLLRFQPHPLFAGTLKLAYSTYLGGSGDAEHWDVASGIGLGTGGEVYVVGTTETSDFPTVNPYQAIYHGANEDVFVSRLSSSGSSLVYSTYLGGHGDDGGSGITLGPGGEVYVTGNTASADFPVLDPYQASNASGVYGDDDVFVSKLSSSGSSLVYSTYLGGLGDDYGCGGIALGTQGEAYVAGYTSSGDFPVVSAYQEVFGAGSWDAFVSRLSSSGSSLVYSTYLGGSDSDLGYGLALGTGGGAYVTGYTLSPDFPTVNSYQASWGDYADVFVSRLSASGSSLVYSTYLGGSDAEEGNALALGTEGEAYVTGYTESDDFPTRNPYQASHNRQSYHVGDAFVIRLDSSGSALIYSTYLGGWEMDEGWGITLGTGGDAYVAGRTFSFDFPDVNPYQSSLGGPIYDDTDAFVSRLSASGSSLVYSTFLGGSSYDRGEGITLGPEGEVYVAGATESLNFPTVNPYQANNRGIYNAFVSKLIYVPSKWIYDYNGDGTSDIAIFRGSSGMWSVREVTRAYFGTATDDLVPSDYDGDGATDIAIFRENGGLWSVRNLTRFYFGSGGDEPVPGDYDGNGTAEAGLFRGSAGMWAIRGVTRAYFGSAGDTVIPGYYDSDAVKDIAIFRGSTGMWSVRGVSRFYFGASTDELVPGDYNGMGKWEGGIFRPSSGMWSIRNVSRFYLGNSTDWPLPADYDGNGADDAGIFRDSSGMWAVRNLSRVYFGSTNDIPVTR